MRITRCVLFPAVLLIGHAQGLVDDVRYQDVLRGDQAYQHVCNETLDQLVGSADQIL